MGSGTVTTNDTMDTAAVDCDGSAKPFGCPKEIGDTLKRRTLQWLRLIPKKAIHATWRFHSPLRNGNILSILFVQQARACSTLYPFSSHPVTSCIHPGPYIRFRAWSYAMALKQDSNTEPRKKFHSICRLQKARDHSEILFNLTSESIRVDARTKLECEAYHAFITATFFFELQNWGEAVEHFKKAQ